jgi:hypothetical protein
VKTISIGYFPISSNLNGPGDRRRLAFWANQRGHRIVVNSSSKVDVVIATANSDFHRLSNSNIKVPIIFDLVDAYLTPTKFLEDLGRGIAKKVTGQISGGIKSYRTHLTDFCSVADAIICSSVEQKSQFIKLNQNVHVILDSHEEFQFNDAREYVMPKLEETRVLWEGQPQSLLGFEEIDSVLGKLLDRHSIQLDLVTDLKYYKLLNRYFEMDTREFIHEKLKGISQFATIVPWSAANLHQEAKLCSLALIPTDLSIPLIRLKPENRMLIMWRLGLPCLASASPSNTRVSRESGTSVICENAQDWDENIELMLSDPDYAQKQLILGQNYLRDHHNKDIVLSKWDNVVNSVL